MTDPRTPKSKKREWRKLPCPRCGGDCLHRAKFRELTVPSVAGTFSFSAWAICAALGEPIALGEVRKDPPVLLAAMNTSATTGTTTVHVDHRFAVGTWTS